MNTDDIANIFTKSLYYKDFVTDKTGCKTIEIVGASFHADKPAIFGVPNEDYIQRELEWYKSCSLNVYDIPGGPPEIWKQVADKDGNINSNYGWCIYSEENGNQYKRVLDELSLNPNSRRAVMLYTRPTMHEDYNKNGMSDFMCTNAVQYMIRGDVLLVIVQMRSNDVVFGYRNDFAWQDYVAKQLQTQLNLNSRRITWQCGSLHVYERHFHLLEKEVSSFS